MQTAMTSNLLILLFFQRSLKILDKAAFSHTHTQAQCGLHGFTWILE
jgi:hypothetical protein